MNTTMNAVTSATGRAEQPQLFEQLARRVDGNRDGQVTSAEFSNFLAGLMQSLDAEVASHRVDATSESTAASAPSPVLLQAADPGTLTRAQGAALLRQAFDTTTRSR